MLAKVRVVASISHLLSESSHLYIKLGYHAGDVQPRVRWAVIFSGLHYTIIYVPRTPGRPTMFCSPILPFCLPIGDEQEPFIQPIWSILVYMLLVETLEVDDETLRERLGVVVPPEILSSSISGSKIDTRGRRCSGRPGIVIERNERQGSSALINRKLMNFSRYNA